ncbi:MAG: Planctomycete cytochrome, partial [Verrucomicrobiales bacterium]|nr:Planctomycete cytochrome [Verrucomicrobiales bacterium]
MSSATRFPSDRPVSLAFLPSALLPFLVASAALAAPTDPAAGTSPLYNRDIRPILSDNCFNCHGPDSASRKAGLRLDTFEGATTPNKDGVVGLIPGKPDESEIIKRALTTDVDDVMPPPETHKSLKPEQIDTLKRWIAEGAKYQAHWSFIAPQLPAIPAVAKKDWVKNPIDQFVLANLEANGLQPSPEADRRTLARRVSLDLTGLPPEPALVEAFVSDPDPQAYEKLVDRLMASPAWGEHRTRYWLDYARYADTHGIHFDNYREMWHYRQNVTEAFNRNQPFDQFTIEQIAGDLLPNRTLEQQIASGFNRCNITTNEGGAIAEEYLVLYARDRVEATSQVWLGLTTGCAVCHDHKFDPVTQKEFYQLAAFFNNTTQNAMDGNIAETPPMVVVPPKEDRERWDALPAVIADTGSRLEKRKIDARPEFVAWLAATKPDYFQASASTGDFRLNIPLNEAAGPAVSAKTPTGVLTAPAAAGVAAIDGPVEGKGYQVTAGTTVEFPGKDGFERDTPFSYGAWVRIPKDSPSGAIFARMESANAYRGWDLWLEQGRVGTHIIGKWSSDALKVVTKKPIPAEQWQHVFVTYDGSGKAAGVTVYVNGNAEPVKIDADSLTGSIKGENPIKLGQRHQSDRLDGVTLQDVRLYNRRLDAAEVASLSRSPALARILTKPAAQRTPAEVDTLFAWYLETQDKPSASLREEIAKLEQEKTTLRGRSAVTHVMQEKGGEAEAYLLMRGAYDKRGDRLTPATPAVLPAMPADLPKNRLGFAQWLLRPEHPLTARVTVNRFWQEVFGTGLVASSGDFGVSGQLPTHPELLDWMAVTFRDQGWNLKEFFRQMVTSATYRQSSKVTPELLVRDPSNKLLARGPRFRMDAEMVRDYALSTSGLLVNKIGGPSVRPYQPDGIWDAVAMPESNTRIYKADTGEGLYRRSMYTFWKRAAPPASMDNFNAPARENCTVKRERTNTPLQALNTLNDIQFIEAARVLAEHVIKEGGATPISRLNYLSDRVISRAFTPDEQVILLASLIN